DFGMLGIVISRYAGGKMRRFLFCLAFAGFGAFLGASAQADTFDGSSFAHFHDPSGAVDQTHTTISSSGPGETNNVVTSGQPTVVGGLPNSLSMLSLSFAGVNVGQ